MMESACSRMANHHCPAGGLHLDRAPVRCLFTQSVVRSIFVVIRRIFKQKPPQMILTEGDHMVHQFATATGNPPLSHAVLPGTSALLHFGHSFLSNTQNPRSIQVRCGLGPFSMRMANCCRSARFSMARSVLDRKKDPTERNSAVTMRYNILIIQLFYFVSAIPSIC